MKYRLLVTDIDGTLLSAGSQLTPPTRRVIAELQRRGIRVALSTARPPRAIGGLYRELGLTDPVIAYNGHQLAASGLSRRVEVTSSGSGFVEILAAGVSKGTALQAPERVRQAAGVVARTDATSGWADAVSQYVLAAGPIREPG